MPFVSLHIRSFKKSMHDPGIVLTYCSSRSEMGSYDRPLEFRGCFPTFIATRECSQSEYDSEAGRYRMLFVTYPTWDELIADEHKMAVRFDQHIDQSWFDTLDRLSKIYDQFLTKVSKHKNG